MDYSASIDEIVEKYGRLNKLTMYDAMTVICAYREAIGEKDFAFYESQRKAAIPPKQETNNENKSL